MYKRFITTYGALILCIIGCISVLGSAVQAADIVTISTNIPVRDLEELLPAMRSIIAQQSNTNIFLRVTIDKTLWDNYWTNILKNVESDSVHIEPERPDLPVQPGPGALVVYHADEALSFKTNNYRIMRLYGNCDLEYEDMIIRADTVEYNSELDVLVAYGNVRVFKRVDAEYITCEKLVFHPEEQRGVFYDVLYERENGESIRARKVTVFSNDSFSANGARFIPCDCEDPDDPYSTIEAGRVWSYPDERLIVLSAWYRIGQVRVFYTPFFYSTKWGTGISTYWGRSSHEGFFAQNTYILPLRYTQKYRDRIARVTGKENAMIYKFDWYQRLGEYFGFDYHRRGLDGQLFTELSIADEKRILSSDRNKYRPDGYAYRIVHRGFPYQWKAAFSGRAPIREAEESSHASIQWNVFRMSDVSYLQHFETYRHTKPGFDFKDLRRTGGAHDYYRTHDPNWYVSLNDTRGRSSLNITTRWNYQWYTPEERYVLGSTTMPRIRYTLSGTIDPVQKRYSTNYIPIISTNAIYVTNTANSSNAGMINTNIQYTTNMKQVIKTLNDPFAANIGYSVYATMTHNDYYDMQDNGKLNRSTTQRDIKATTSRSIPFKKIKWFSTSMNGYLGDTAKWGRNSDYQRMKRENENYRRQSYTYYGFGDRYRIGIKAVNVTLSHDMSWKTQPSTAFDEYGRRRSHNVGARYMMDFAHFTANADISMNLLTKINERIDSLIKNDHETVQEYRRRIKPTLDRLSPLTLRSSYALVSASNIFSVRLNDTYVYNFTFYEQTNGRLEHIGSINNTLQMNNTWSPRYITQLIDKNWTPFRSTLSWYHDYGNERKQTLDYSFGINIPLEKLRLQLTLNGKNERLYYYNKRLAEKYIIYGDDGTVLEGYRNFFTDLGNSLNPFNPVAQRDSYFKLRSVNFSLIRDLCCWELRASYSLSRQFMTVGKFINVPYFEHVVAINIQMRNQSDLKLSRLFRTDKPSVK